MYASDLQLTNWRGQKIVDTTQDLNPGGGNNEGYENEDYLFKHPADEFPGEEQAGDSELTGVDTDFDANPKEWRWILIMARPMKQSPKRN